MENKELIIDKDTKLDKIPNKEEYTKLIIKTNIISKKLIHFTNIKELVFDGLMIKKSNLDKNILNLSFLKTVEKITFRNIDSFGLYTDYNLFRSGTFQYFLDYQNVKSIEFPKEINYIFDNYLIRLKNLEEIIYNVDNHTYFQRTHHVKAEKLKRIVLKFFEKEYILNLDYEINTIDYIRFNRSNSSITIQYQNNDVKSFVTINTHTDKIRIENVLFKPDMNNGVLNIPDYITDLTEYCTSDVKELSFNLKLLDNIISEKPVIVYSENNRKIETITLRNSNNMLLFPEKIIDIKEYGELERFYIKNKLLHLKYNECDLTIDSNGNIEKIEKRNNKQNIDLNKYTANQLKEYMCYKMLLEISNENDSEYKKAMKVVEDRVIKRLIKK